MWYKIQNSQIILNIIIQPGARKSEIVGIYDDRLKIRLQAPPVDGKANKLLVKFVAKLFNVPSKNVKLLKGHKSKLKKIEVLQSQIDPEHIYEI